MADTPIIFPCAKPTGHIELWQLLINAVPRGGEMRLMLNSEMQKGEIIAFAPILPLSLSKQRGPIMHNGSHRCSITPG